MVWYTIVEYGIAWYPIVRNSTVWHSMTWYSTVKNMRILDFGSEAQHRGIPEAVGNRILVYVVCWAPVQDRV